MTNSQNCRYKQGIGPIGVVIAAWLGSSIAFGSCGSCNLTEEISKKLSNKGNTGKIEQKLEEIETNLSNKLENNYGINNAQVYSINGENYICVPAQK